MPLTAPDYVFVALYTLTKIAIAFVLTRIFGIVLKYKGNYDLYISTSSLSIASLLSAKGNSNLFRKHGSAAIIPISITLLILITEGFPTLMTRFTPVAKIIDIAQDLNFTTSNVASYFVPSYSGTKEVDMNTGMPTVDVPRTSNDSLAWAGLGSLRKDYTFLYDLNYREQEQIYDNGNITFTKFAEKNHTSTTEYFMLRYGNISVDLSEMLHGVYAINKTILSQTPTYLTAVFNYRNVNLTTKDSENTSPFSFDADIRGDKILKKDETEPSEFLFGKLSNNGGAIQTTFDPSMRLRRYTYHSFAKVAYFTEEYADYVIARSGYSVDLYAYSNSSHQEMIELKMKHQSRPQYEIDEALNLLSKTDPTISQLFFSVTTVSPGKVRLAILSHASIHYTGYSAFEGTVRFVAQNITISSFPANHIDKTEMVNVHITDSTASAGINQNDHTFSTDNPIKLRRYGILAGDYSSFVNQAYDSIKDLPIIAFQTVTLSENYDPKAAILNLDLARTVAGACSGDLCIKLAHVYYQKELTTGILFGICAPIAIALLLFVTTYKSRQDLFFADMPDAIAVVTKKISNENDTTSIPPNPHYIKLVESGHTRHKYMTIDDQILKKGADDHSLITDERTSFIK